MDPIWVAGDISDTFMDLVYDKEPDEIGEAKESTTVVFHYQRVSRGANSFL